MQSTWSEAKRTKNLKGHAIAFPDAVRVFEGPTARLRTIDSATTNGASWTLGLLAGIPVSIVHNEDQDEIRVVSFRKATKRETESTSMRSKTDWAHVKTSAPVSLPDDQPDAAVRHIVREVVRRGLAHPPAKASISLRVDQDVLEWFKAQGPGYQTRINTILRAFRDASV